MSKVEPTVFVSGGVRKEYDKTTWIRIGRLCSAGRRSTWARVNNQDGIESIELCSGREGDDSYVKIDKDNPAYHGIHSIVTDQFFAIDSLELEEEILGND